MREREPGKPSVQRGGSGAKLLCCFFPSWAVQPETQGQLLDVSYSYTEMMPFSRSAEAAVILAQIRAVLCCVVLRWEVPVIISLFSSSYTSLWLSRDKYCTPHNGKGRHTKPLFELEPLQFRSAIGFAQLPSRLWIQSPCSLFVGYWGKTQRKSGASRSCTCKQLK